MPDRSRGFAPLFLLADVDAAVEGADGQFRATAVDGAADGLVDTDSERAIGEAVLLGEGACAVFGQGDALRQEPAWASRRLDHGYRPMVLLHYNLGPVPELLQHDSEVVRHLGSSHADLFHIFDHMSSRSPGGAGRHGSVEHSRSPTPLAGLAVVP